MNEPAVERQSPARHEDSAPETQNIPMRYLRENWDSLGLISVVAWIANYLHFTGFGLYADDWFYIGFPFSVTAKTWLAGTLVQHLTDPALSMGRPLSYLLSFTFSEIGAALNSLEVDYLIAFLLFATSACVMYAALRYRFSKLLSTLAALLFVITPLHTLRQFLNGQFSVAPAFILVFGAMLLYVKGKRSWAYLVAPLSILCYESMFFLFIGAPLLRQGSAFKGRRREWLVHLGACGAMVALYFLARKILFSEARVSSLGLQATIWPVLHSWLYCTFASFATYLYAALQIHAAPLDAYLYLILFLAMLGGLVYRQRHVTDEDSRSAGGFAGMLQAAGIGFIFVSLGCVVSYFFFKAPEPKIAFVDRDTRILMAASFGSSILVAALLSGLIQLSRGKLWRFAAYACTGIFLSVLFLYSFLIQNDYVTDWRDQREQALQVIALTPDVQTDSLLVLKLGLADGGFFAKGRRARGIGMEKYIYEQTFGYTYAPNRPWPKLMVVYSDSWSKYLKRDPDGLMSWTQPVFDGRWNPIAGRFRPGRFIVLEENSPGCLIRKYEPIMVDGLQIVQQLPSGKARTSLWTMMTPTPLARMLLPEFIWHVDQSSPDAGSDAVLSTSGDSDSLLISPASGTVFRSSPVTFTWRAVPGAQDYWIDVGTALTKGNIWGGFTGGATSKTVDIERYLTGEPVYLQIYSKSPNVTLVPGTGSLYRFATQNPNIQLLTPASGTVLTKAPVTFTWKPVHGAQDYWIDVGSAAGKGNVFAGYTKGATTATIDLRTYLNGRPVYVQIYPKFPGGAAIVPGSGAKFEYATQSPSPR